MAAGARGAHEPEGPRRRDLVVADVDPRHGKVLRLRVPLFLFLFSLLSV